MQWAQRDKTLQENNTFSDQKENRLLVSYSDPEALWTKIKNLTALFSHKRELYASKEIKENAVASEGKSWRPEIQKPQKINKRVMTSQWETGG